MTLKRFSILISLNMLLCFMQGQSPVKHGSLADASTGKEIHGRVFDRASHTPLPYANIYMLKNGKGTISNESGYFSFSTVGMEASDTIRFQYIGYKTRLLSLGELSSDSVVMMDEEIINLSETIIFGNMPDLSEIVRNVLVYKDSNYRETTNRQQVFIRDRNTADFHDIKVKFKKSTIDELDRDQIENLKARFPRNITSYTDFLGDLYFSDREEDSIRLKIDPARAVALKEEDVEVLEQIQRIFMSLIEDTGEEEYWKVRSGIFGQKLDFGDDTLQKPQDSLQDFRTNLDLFRFRVNYQLRFSSFEDEDQWEFLHKTGRYRYTLVGGTRVNGEDAYIIDFVPDGRGIYEGRMVIGMESFALIRADYRYAPGETGTDFQLLGVGYTEKQFDGSIYFEKGEDGYHLRYFSYRSGASASLDRTVNLIKKRERWLFDKTLNELKLGIDLALDTQESVEYLVLEHEKIDYGSFAGFDQVKFMKMIYVDQFDEDLWRGYSIIEPTRQMREYRKQEVNFQE